MGSVTLFGRSSQSSGQNDILYTNLRSAAVGGRKSAALRVSACSNEKFVVPSGMPVSLDASPFAGVTQYYDRFRAPYAQAAIDFIVEAYDLSEGVRALDLGCGPGTITLDLAARVAPGRVVGVDREPGVVAEAQRVLGSRPSSGVEFRTADAYALEFDDGKLLLGKYETLGNVNWDNLVTRVGRDVLQSLFDDATLIATPPAGETVADAAEAAVEAHRSHRRAWYADAVGPLLVRADQAGDRVLICLLAGRLIVSRFLVGQAAEHKDGRAVGVLQITPDAATEVGLKLDALLRASQEVSYSRVKPVVPA